METARTKKKDKKGKKSRLKKGTNDIFEAPPDFPDDFPIDLPEDLPDDVPKDLPDDIPDDIPSDMGIKADALELPDDLPDVFKYAVGIEGLNIPETLSQENLDQLLDHFPNYERLDADSDKETHEEVNFNDDDESQTSGSNAARSLSNRRIHPVMSFSEISADGVDPVPGLKSPAITTSHQTFVQNRFSNSNYRSSSSDMCSSDSDTVSPTPYEPMDASVSTHMQSVLSPKAFNNMATRKDSLELATLREKVKSQDRELIRVKRFLIAHDMFYKWKVWYLTRLKEHLMIEMESERKIISSRLKSAASKLQERGDIPLFHI